MRERNRKRDMDSNLFPQLPGQCYAPGRAIKATPRFEESVLEQPVSFFSVFQFFFFMSF